MATRLDREADVWLSDEQLAKLTRADEADELHSPIPTQMVSNGEYMPIPQTDEQKRVEARLKEHRGDGQPETRTSAGVSSSPAPAAWPRGFSR